jgi:hypothetical protein
VGCPFCAGLRVSVTNSLATFAPRVAAEWHPSRNGGMTPSMVGAGSKKKYWWRCDKGHEWQSTPSNRALRGTGCPRCAVRTGGRPRRVRRHAPSHATRGKKAQLARGRASGA